ncbi:uncharacterized protein SOCE26_064450 [Sorangium cellulosum]|uniref:Uncharacterized protein n=1 Tax=Sorangium cellulosum TaxID=56 RepID=A0A2L0F0A4_SORCE|nr:uncharacterized protein SOCE26_064450 [Sorangium cellulosum]
MTRAVRLYELIDRTGLCDQAGLPRLKRLGLPRRSTKRKASYRIAVPCWLSDVSSPSAREESAPSTSPANSTVPATSASDPSTGSANSSWCGWSGSWRRPTPRMALRHLVGDSSSRLPERARM